MSKNLTDKQQLVTNLRAIIALMREKGANKKSTRLLVEMLLHSLVWYFEPPKKERYK